MAPTHDPVELPAASSMDERKTERRAASFAARLHGPSVVAPSVRVLDLSHLGCRVSTPQALSVGAFVTLALPRFTDIDGWIAWRLDGEVGLDFAHPLPLRVVDYLLDRAPPPSRHHA